MFTRYCYPSGLYMLLSCLLHCFPCFSRNLWQEWINYTPAQLRVSSYCSMCLICSIPNMQADGSSDISSDIFGRWTLLSYNTYIKLMRVNYVINTHMLHIISVILTYKLIIFDVAQCVCCMQMCVRAVDFRPDKMGSSTESVTSTRSLSLRFRKMSVKLTKIFAIDNFFKMFQSINQSNNQYMYYLNVTVTNVETLQRWNKFNRYIISWNIINYN